MQAEINDGVITLWSDQDDEIAILKELMYISPVVAFQHSLTYFDGNDGNSNEHFEASVDLKQITEKILK